MRGDSVPAAQVWITNNRTGDDVLARTVTDGEGHFLMAKVPTHANWQLHSSADGRCHAKQTIAPGDYAQITIHDAAVVTGTFLDQEARPVVGAIVRATLEARALWDTTCDAVTDAHGHFELPAVALGDNHIAAWLDGVGLTQVRRKITGDCAITLRPVDAATTQLKIEVVGLPASFDQTIDLRLLPYEGGRLTYLPPPMRNITLTTAWQCDVLPDVAYTVSLHHAKLEFLPRSIDATPGRPHVYRVTANSAPKEPQACFALVRDHDGKPVPNITVLLTDGGTEEALASSNADGELTWMTSLPRGRRTTIRSASEGWAVGLSESIQAFLTDKRPVHAMHWDYRPGAEVQLLAYRTSEVQGQLRLPDDRPASHITVQLQTLHPGNDWRNLAKVTSDRDGSFAFRNLYSETKRVRLIVQSPAGYLVGQPFELANPGETVDTGPVTLRASASIEGIVRDDRKRPMPGVEVLLRQLTIDGNEQTHGDLTATITDKLGRYRFVGIPTGVVMLTIAQSRDQAPTTQASDTFEVEPGKTHSHDLVAGEH